MGVQKDKLPLRQPEPTSQTPVEKAQIIRLPAININDYPLTQTVHNTSQVKSKVELIKKKIYIVRSELELVPDEIVILKEIDMPKPNWITVELVNHGGAKSEIYLADLGIIQYENLPTWNPINWLENPITHR
jgi:hypothetical protein